MIRKYSLILLVLAFAPFLSWAKNPTGAQIPSPVIGTDTWVMIEVWPEVNDITFSAYFLDFSSEKNKNLCELAKRVFDRDQEQRAKKDKRKYTSTRVCLSLHDANEQGYVRNK